MDNLTQNTPEWEKIRKEKIGASDAPIIMGVSPYGTPYSLWQKKLSLIPSDITHKGMERGHRLEPLARAQAEERLGVSLHPKVKFHPCISWMMASLDGLSEDESVLIEIKCPNAQDHQMALDGQIPEKYYPQLQHQLEVCQLEWGYYFSYDGQQGVMVTFYRDDEYIKNLLQEEKKFYACMEDLTPPSLTERDYQTRDNPDWLEIASRWRKVNSQLSALEEEEKKLREALISLSENQNSLGGGIKLSKLIRKGNVDYSKIPELKAVDLEKFRKSPIGYWKISPSKS